MAEQISGRIFDRYVIEPPQPPEGFIVGDMIDMLTGDIIAGPYCEWPKHEPLWFVVTSVS